LIGLATRTLVLTGKVVCIHTIFLTLDIGEATTTNNKQQDHTKVTLVERDEFQSI